MIVGDKIPESIKKIVESEFRVGIQNIFKDNLIFGLIFGGFGKGYASQNHDIDMFILVNKIDPAQKLEFTDWYFALHDKFGFKPDPIDPGEVAELGDLLNRITLLEASHIRPVIETYYEYEGIVWVDALSEGNRGLTIVNKDISEEIFRRAKSLNTRWREEILSIRTDPPESLASLDLRRLFKGHIKYLKAQGITDIPENS
jgi:hypothetical protein